MERSRLVVGVRTSSRVFFYLYIISIWLVVYSEEGVVDPNNYNEQYKVSKLMFSKRRIHIPLPPHLREVLDKNCSDLGREIYPVINVQYGDEKYKSTFGLNHTLESSPDHYGHQFMISCISSYPIRWDVNYFYNGNTHATALALHLVPIRRTPVFEDPSTYRFIITSKMRYRNSHGFKNFSFTCLSVHRPECLRTKMFTSSSPESFININGNGGSPPILPTIHPPSSTGPFNGNNIILGQNRGRIWVNIIQDTSWTDESNPEDDTTDQSGAASSIKKTSTNNSISSPSRSPVSSCNSTLYFKSLGWNRFRVRCNFKDGTPGIVKSIQNCPNVVSCMAFIRLNINPHFLVNSCMAPLDPTPPNSGISPCANCLEKITRLSQGYLTCKPNTNDGNPTDETHMFYMTSVPKPVTTLYNNPEDIDPSEMLALSPIRAKVTVGDQITILCNVSDYYFASGARIAVKYKGSDHLTFSKVSLEKLSDYGGTIYETNIPITTDTIERVYCLAPVWNSFEWVNKSYPINVLHAEEEFPSTHLVLAVSSTLLMTMLLCFLLFGLCWVKVLKRKQFACGKLLTQQEIEEFRQYRRSSIGNGTKGQRPHPNSYDYVQVDGLSDKFLYDESFEVKRDNILLDETGVLGKGHFGIVLKGVLKDEKKCSRLEVAVKTLKTKTDVGALKALLSELKIMASVGRHPNVVNLVAACTRRMDKGEVYVAVEYCANGNLQIFLRQHRGNFRNQLQGDTIVVDEIYSIRQSVSDDIVKTMDLVKWAWEISKGMEFLSSKKVIHGDLATRNILLTGDHIAKISDFGLSRQLVDYYYVKEESLGPMPWKWMAIESLTDMKFSIQTDIWSCGVTLWELFTLADIPYCGCSWSAEFVQTLSAGHRLGKPQFATSEIYDLMRQCWVEDPCTRPSFFDIKMFFEDILTQCSHQEYMELSFRPVKSSRNPSQKEQCPLELNDSNFMNEDEMDDDVFEQL